MSFGIIMKQHQAVFDFKTENRDIAAFIRICQQENMWVLLRRVLMYVLNGILEDCLPIF
jgi:hypothetical protein